MKLSKGTIAFIIFVVLIVFAYLSYTYVFQARMQKIEQLDNDTAITAEKIAEGRRIAASLPALKVEYKALLEKLDFLEVMLPKEKEIPDLLVMIPVSYTHLTLPTI